MKQINCIAIDDEPLALNIIEKHVNKLPFLNLVAKCKNALDAYTIIQSQQIDLLLIDIQMPEISGLDFVKSIPSSIHVIFTTAYPEYAAKSYELNALDYLVKPIPFDRFFAAINKLPKNDPPKISTDAPLSKELIEDSFIFVKSGYKMIKINFDDIYYIESIKDYVHFHTSNGEIASLLSISSLIDRLPSTKFCRIHRSFIIALNKIDSIERSLICINNQTLKIGDHYREFFFKQIEHNKL